MHSKLFVCLVCFWHPFCFSGKCGSIQVSNRFVHLQSSLYFPHDRLTRYRSIVSEAGSFVRILLDQENFNFVIYFGIVASSSRLLNCRKKPVGDERECLKQESMFSIMIRYFSVWYFPEYCSL